MTFLGKRSPQMTFFSSSIKYFKLKVGCRNQTSYSLSHVTNTLTFKILLLFKYKNKFAEKTIFHSFRVVAPHDMQIGQVHRSSNKGSPFIKKTETY